MPNYTVHGAIVGKDIYGVGEYDDWVTSSFYSPHKPSPAQAQAELVADFRNINSDVKIVSVRVYGIKDAATGQWV